MEANKAHMQAELQGKTQAAPDTDARDEPAKPNRMHSAITLIGTVVLAGIVAYVLIRHVHQLEAFIQAHGLLGVLASIALQTFFGASPIPTEPLTLINGAVFGPLLGALISWTGYMLASLIEYYLGTRVHHMADFENSRHKLPLGLGRFPADSPWFLIAARVIPGYGPKMVGLVGGMYHVKLWRFTWTAAIANAFGALIFAWGGHGLHTLIGL